MFLVGTMRRSGSGFLQHAPAVRFSSSAILAVTTVADRGSAMKLARGLVDNKLVACVNVIPGVTSVYRWKANVETSDEMMLLMKTTRERYDAVQSFIKENHPYEVPELIQFKVEDGLPAYLKWIVDETSSGARE